MSFFYIKDEHTEEQMYRWEAILVVLLAVLQLQSAFQATRDSRVRRGISSITNAVKYVSIGGEKKLVDVDVNVEGPSGPLLEPNTADMKEMAFLLSNITDFLDSEPEKALSVASQQMAWCFQRNVPQLTQMLLAQYPALREDRGMMKAYIFLLDFLEAVSKETGVMLTNNQKTLRILLEAAKVDDATLTGCLIENTERVCKEEFLIFLDSEIESQEVNSPLEALLVTLRLRIIEEMGKSLGTDVTILPKLASLDDRNMLQTKTNEHLATYNNIGGMELFLQALRMMINETTKRYKDVDAALLENLKEIELLTTEAIAANREGTPQ